MTTETDLLASVLREPEEDTPRLMYADWLDDNAGTVCRHCDGNKRVAVQWGRLSRETIDMACRACGGTGEGSHSDGRRELAEFIRGTGPGSDKTLSRDDRGRLVRYFAGTVVNQLGRDAQYVHYNSIRYGFVDWIRIPFAAFVANGRALFRRHPIRTVFLSDRKPVFVHDRFFYWPCLEEALEPDSLSDTSRASFTAEHDLPDALFRYLQLGTRHSLSYMAFRAYFTREEAIDDLHRACVRYGRELAGLPPLKKP